MRYIRYVSIAIFGIALIVVSLANRQMVSVQVLPPELSSLAAVNPQAEVPLFAVLFGGILVGLLVGFVWEFMIEQRKHSQSRRHKAEADKLRRELDQMKAEKHKGKDEVLALLEEA